MLNSLILPLFLLIVFLVIVFSFSQSPNYSLTKPNIEEKQEYKTILEEINTFANTKPTSLSQIKEWLDTKNYSDPLEGIDLAGINKEFLLSKRVDLSAQRELTQKIHDNEEWKDYLPLWTSMDGNCFFHTFSVMLVGDESLSDRLRVKMCLELMNDNNSDLEEINNCLPIMSKDKEWQLGEYAHYMAYLLKRPVTLVYHWNEQELTWLTYDISDNDSGETNLYHEPFIIYHTGGIHFVPLVKR